PEALWRGSPGCGPLRAAGQGGAAAGGARGRPVAVLPSGVGRSKVRRSRTHRPAASCRGHPGGSPVSDSLTAEPTDCFDALETKTMSHGRTQAEIQLPSLRTA
ncbi:hypothetical protein DV515_00009647, partial [Chloebia gouldiae]